MAMARSRAGAQLATIPRSFASNAKTTQITIYCIAYLLAFLISINFFTRVYAINSAHLITSQTKLRGQINVIT